MKLSEENLNYDKYGYAVVSSTRRLDKNKLYVDITYSSKNENEPDFILRTINKKQSFLKNIQTEKNIESYLKHKSIAVGIAKVINDRFGYMRFFSDSELNDFIKTLPQSLIMNNEAIRELLWDLPNNEHLIVCVADLIKERRKEIKEEQEAYLQANEHIFKKYEEIKQEFGLEN